MNNKITPPVKGTYNIALQFQNHNVLYRKIKLPISARKNISKVLDYEFNKYFPLNIDDVLMSYDVIPSSVNKESIEIKIWVINKTIVEWCLETLRNEYEICVNKLFIEDASGRCVITHDVAYSQSLCRIKNKSSYNKKLNLANMMMLFVILIYPVIKMDFYLDEIRNNISDLEVEARPVLLVRDKITAQENRLQYLINKKLENPNHAFVWSKITGVLSKNAVLDVMKIDGRDITIEGRSISVEKIIKILESDPGFSNVKVNGSVASLSKSGRETMKISMFIKE